MWSWINGRLVPVSDSSISVVDHGFTVGDGVFETIKTVDGQPIALTRHIERLNASAGGLGLPLLDPDAVREAVSGVLAAERHPLGVLRVTYTSGPGPLGSDRGDQGCTLAAVSLPGKPWPATTRLHVSRWPRNERSPLVGLKTTSYAENAFCLAEAKQLGAGEAVLANMAGNLCEGTGSNVFVVRDGVAYTPPLSDGCLAGITRALVVQWCDVVEQTMPMSVLDEADEVFITSSTRDVHAVSAIDGREIPAPGSVTLAIAAEYARRIQRDPDPS